MSLFAAEVDVQGLDFLELGKSMKTMGAISCAFYRSFNTKIFQGDRDG